MVSDKISIMGSGGYGDRVIRVGIGLYLSFSTYWIITSRELQDFLSSLNLVEIYCYSFQTVHFLLSQA